MIKQVIVSGVGTYQTYPSSTYLPKYGHICLQKNKLTHNTHNGQGLKMDVNKPLGDIPLGLISLLM